MQELFTSLYFCDVEDYNNFKLSESIPGPSTDALSEVAKELNVVIIASLFEKGHKAFTTTQPPLLMQTGNIFGKISQNAYPRRSRLLRKILFYARGFRYKVWKTKFATFGVLICWDQWYPEAARITSLMGAEILFYPTAIGWSTAQDEATNVEQYNAWQTIQRSHAVANGVHVVGVNRVGFEQDGRHEILGRIIH